MERELCPIFISHTIDWMLTCKLLQKDGTPITFLWEGEEDEFMNIPMNILVAQDNICMT